MSNLPPIEELEEVLTNDEYMGWCTECQEWTHDCAEHDAENYDCPVCEKPTVQGALNILVTHPETM